MTTDREFQNARRDYERQVAEARPSWWRQVWHALRDLAREFADDLSSRPASRPSARRQRQDRKQEIERAAKGRL